MKLKSLLFGTAAALVATTGARAADAIVYAEPEPMEYVRICDVYGAGFFYIPGTETCLKIDGYVRFRVTATKGTRGYQQNTRTRVNFDARSETELGTLRGYIVGRRDLELVVDYRKLADGHVDSGANREPAPSE